jgi:hypothetical protein
VNHAAAATIDALEPRRLLSTYYVPSTYDSQPVTDVYLAVNSETGNVDVHLNSPSALVPAGGELDGAPSGSTDTIIAAGSGITLHVNVPGIDQPSGGISFQSGSNSTMEIDAGAFDTQLTLTANSATSGSVELDDPTDGTVVDDAYGAGVNHLRIITDNTGGATVNASYLASATALSVDCGSGQHNTINIGTDAETGNETVIGAVVTATGGNNAVSVKSDGDDQSSASIDLGTSSGNTVTVLPDCTATLADHLGDGHTVTVDTVNLDSYATLIVAEKSAIGSATVPSNASLVVEGSGTTINSLAVSGTADIEAPTFIGSVTGGGTGAATEFTGASPPPRSPPPTTAAPCWSTTARASPSAAARGRPRPRRSIL